MVDPSILGNALRQLETSLAYLRSEMAQQDTSLRAQFRGAAIQAFEFTYEAAMSAIRRALGELPKLPLDLRSANFLDVMRVAADAGLIRDPIPFRAWRQKRNVTSHTYDESKAEEVVGGLDDFVADIRFLLVELERRNGA
jgi:nucleotidyltransferase substrate binding protein (TIGR01987 family)